MAKTFEGNIKLASAIAQTGAQPLDDRVVVASKSDLYNSFGTAIYQGMHVVVTDENAAYILVDTSKVATAEGWKKVGDGKGAIDASNYTAALALATNDNKGQIIYALAAEGTKGQAGYHEAGPYIVMGAGSLQFLTTDSGTGETPIERIAALESKVGDKSVSTQVTEGIAAIADASAIAENNGVSVKVTTGAGSVKSVVVDASGVATAAQGAKADTAIQGAKAGETTITVDASKNLQLGTMAAETAADYLKKTDTSIFTEAEKTKLGTVVENAQLNHIKVNGKDIDGPSWGADGKRYQDITISEGNTNGTIRVAGVDDVSVHGLKSAAFEDASAFDAAGAAAAAEASANAYTDSSVAALKLEVDKKLNAADTSIFTGDEKTKLAGIDSGAQVNKIETVKVDGSVLQITDKAVDIHIPDAVVYKGENAIAVSEVADNSAKVSLKLNDVSILSQNADGLKATLSIAYNDQKIQLKGIEGKLISEFDASMFVKDGMIEDASLVVNPEGKPAGTYIKITFNTASGKQPIFINVTSLIDVYTAGPGIDINAKAISVKKDVDDEGYLTVSETGVKVTGINAAIAAAVEGLAKDASLQAVATKLGDVSTALDNVIIALGKTDASLADVSAKLADVSTALDGVISNLAKTDASLADVSTALDGVIANLALTDASLATEVGRMDTLLETLAGNGFIKKVEVSNDASTALTASTDASGNVTLGIAAKLQGVLDGFDAKLDASDIVTGSTNGTIAVKGTDVVVKGLKTAAYEDASAFMKYNDMDWQVVE